MALPDQPERLMAPISESWARLSRFPVPGGLPGAEMDSSGRIWGRYGLDFVTLGGDAASAGRQTSVVTPEADVI